MDEHNYMDDQPGEVPDGFVPGSDADIHVSSIVFTGVIGAVLIIVIVMLLKALYYHTLEAERQRKQGKGIDVTLSDLRSKQLEQVGQYRWVNAHAGQVGLPIDDAMQIVWQEEAARSTGGIEITDWDHNPSDQHAVPGDLVMYGKTGLSGTVQPAGLSGIMRALSNQARENATGNTNTETEPEAGTEAAGESK